MEIIGIDLGSNSLRGVRMRAIEAESHNDFIVVGEYDTTVRTAEGLERSGEICQSAKERVIAGLLELKQALHITPQDKVVALTTQAMRKARNREEVLQEIWDFTQIRFLVISGAKEAEITSLAPKIAAKKIARENPKYKQDCFLLIDMGGASSEFIVCNSDKDLAKSFEIGIVSAKDRYKSVENLLVHKEEFLQPMVDFIQECAKQGKKPQFMMANSGTPTMVCAFKMGLREYDAKAIFGTELTREDFQVELAKFLELSKESQIGLVGMFKADVVPFGIALFTCFMEALGFGECLVVDEGLREGAVIAHTLGLLES
ncbi:phosphatase [Helicobacter sp. MIT 05-5294]|uniref:Ppx/GppA phosphatase family protein n=1 Tax=Helicobacter sp. MIT 05-5294 TaxID=1548150 RepID=UPI00051FA200|nr:phosphatase [Helicobacter sp. MIT 05-5294]TLD86782.1 phosphatase [Helicobacter sp. MIT 05-5294]